MLAHAWPVSPNHSGHEETTSPFLKELDNNLGAYIGLKCAGIQTLSDLLP